MPVATFEEKQSKNAFSKDFKKIKQKRIRGADAELVM